MATAKKPAPPKADIVIDESEFNFYRYVCPRCGATSWSPGQFFYEPGRVTVTHTCWNIVRVGGGECGFRVRTVKDVPSLLWVSPNQKWLIYEGDLRFPPDPEDPYSKAASLDISDGYRTGDVTIDFRGKVVYDHWALYETPQYVRDRAESMLRAELKGFGGPSPARSESPRPGRDRKASKGTRGTRRWFRGGGVPGAGCRGPHVRGWDGPRNSTGPRIPTSAGTRGPTISMR